MGPPGAPGRSQACSGESGRCGDLVLEEGEGRGLAEGHSPVGVRTGGGTR